MAEQEEIKVTSQQAEYDLDDTLLTREESRQVLAAIHMNAIDDKEAYFNEVKEMSADEIRALNREVNPDPENPTRPFLQIFSEKIDAHDATRNETREAIETFLDETRPTYRELLEEGSTVDLYLSEMDKANGFEKTNFTVGELKAGAQGVFDQLPGYVDAPRVKGEQVLDAMKSVDDLPQKGPVDDKREEQYEALKIRVDAADALEPGWGDAGKDVASKGLDWLTDGPIGSFVKNNPMLTMGAAGLGLMTMGGGVPLIGGLLKIVGAGLLLFGGGNLLFKGISGISADEYKNGVSAGPEVNDITRSVNAPEAEVQMNLNKGDIAKVTHGAHDKLGESLTRAAKLREEGKESEALEIECIANDMRVKLNTAYNKLNEGKLSVEEQGQLAMVASHIQTAEDPIAEIKKMREEGVGSPNTVPQIEKLLELRPELVKGTAAETMQGLKDQNLLSITGKDPLGLGIKVNTESSILSAIDKAQKQPTGDMDAALKEFEQGGGVNQSKTPNVPVPTPEKVQELQGQGGGRQ